MPAPLPPPTSNFLDQDERQRLVKSTRKLAGLLGEVPRLVELDDYSRSSSDSGSSADSYYSPYPRSQTSLGFNDLPTPRSASRASNRSARVFSSSRASFISFEDLSDSEEEDSPVELPKALLTLNPAPVSPSSGSKDKSKKPMGPSLYLHLNNTNNSVLNITHPSSPHDDAKTPVPMSPLSPLSPYAVSGVERRRQMASKLCRTLGEHVPPELVVAPPTARPHNRSHSHEEVRSKSCFATQQEAVLRQVHQPTAPARRPSNAYEVVNVHIPVSVAKYYQQEDTVAPLPNSATYGATVGRNPSTRRAGKEWSGEWNHDMQDVMAKLRGLK